MNSIELDAGTFYDILEFIDHDVMYGVQKFNHITYDFTGKTEVPKQISIELIDHFYNDRIQCVTLSINGERKSPDGRWFHVTVSKEMNVESKESNDLINSHYKEA